MPTAETEGPQQREFFDFAGPLFSVVISPAAGTSRRFRAVPRGRRRRDVSEGVSFEREIAEGGSPLESRDAESAVYQAGADPGLVRLKLPARQGETLREAEALIAVTAELLHDEIREPGTGQGPPACTFDRAPGELRRARFDSERDLILISNAHRDYVYASRNRSIKLRYICRLYAKELVLKNFPGLGADRLLERMAGLSLYTEERLR